MFRMLLPFSQDALLKFQLLQLSISGFLQPCLFQWLQLINCEKEQLRLHLHYCGGSKTLWQKMVVTAGCFVCALFQLTLRTDVSGFNKRTVCEIRHNLGDTQRCLLLTFEHHVSIREVLIARSKQA